MSLASYFVWAAIAVTASAFVLQLTGLYGPASRGLLAAVEGLRRARIWHLAIAAASMAVILTLLDPWAARSGVPQFFVAVVAVGLFASVWVREFLFLMSLRDEDLPGRFDKPIWVFFLVALPPVGVFLFRSHRLAHWPEPKAKPAADAAHELA